MRQVGCYYSNIRTIYENIWQKMSSRSGRLRDNEEQMLEKKMIPKSVIIPGDRLLTCANYQTLSIVFAYSPNTVN